MVAGETSRRPRRRPDCSWSPARRISGALILLVTLLVGVQLLGMTAHSAQTAATGPVTVRLSEVVRSVFYAPQYVALVKGFFEDEGLKIDLSTAWGADKGAAALVSGSVDIGFFGPEAAVYIYKQGAADYIVGFAQLTKRDGSFLMSRKPMPNFKWEDVKGKSIVGARKGGVPEMVLEWILRQHGLDPNKDVDITQNLAYTSAPGAFQAGVGEFIAQFEPTISQMEKAGVGYIVASLGVDGGEITYTVYHARKSFIQQHPDVLQKFTNAIYRGQMWVARHSPEEIAEVIAPFFPGTDQDVLIKTIRRYKNQDSWNLTPQISAKGFAHLQAVIEAAGELKGGPIPFQTLMTNRFADKAVAAIKQSD